MTLTMNPALDITTDTDRVIPTDKMRCGLPRYDPGGGGINVARIAHVLGASASAIFPAGGHAGDKVTTLVADSGVPVQRITVACSTRESFTVDEDSTGQQYRFVLPGPRLTDAEQTECLDKLRAVAASADFVVASGSLPPGVPADFYQRVADICREAGALLILDTSGAGLRHITSGVFLLKPSVRELRECVERGLVNESEQLAAAHELVDRGCAQVVVVSLGSKGALVATPTASQHYSPITVPSGSGVGAGDAMVAGITVGLSRGWQLDKAVRLGIAAGAAMLLTPGTAPCTREDVERFFEMVADPIDIDAPRRNDGKTAARNRRPMVVRSSKDIAMTLRVTLDPRYYDAVIFNLDAVLTDIDGVAAVESTIKLAQKLLDVGVATAVYALRPGGQQLLKAAGIDDLFGVCVDGVPAAVLFEATRRLAVRAERSVVVDDAGAGVAAAHDGGFELVIGIDRAGDADRLLGCGADVVVAGLDDIAVRTGDRQMSKLPDAVRSYGQVIGVLGAREPVLFLDYDGTLSPIVNDPGAATLVDGAAKALESLAAQCPVAILSGRDLADIRTRVPIPGIWYAGSHGFELTGPDGTYHRNEAAAAAVGVLERAAAELGESLAEIPGVRVEHKRFAVAVHYREVAPEHIGEIVSATHKLGQQEGLRVTNGRMLVELRPDIDWDKGTTLAWIRDRIDPTGSLLPIYIGDDLTDEDAFDAVQFDGIGIVVRHDEDGDRKTAARFSLQNPDQVREFLQRGSNWLANKHQTSAKAWDFTFEGYDPQSEKLRESLCTLGNGYFATRGAAPESKADQVHYPGSYAAGVYNRLVDDVSGTTIDNESLVNLPNWLALTFRVDGGSWFDIDAVRVLSYRQTLDLRGAVLTREVRFCDDAGRTSSLTQQRFVAMHMPHVGALQTTIVAEDWSGTIEIRSTLDGNVTNSLVERYRDLANNHFELVEKREISDHSVLLTVQTTQSRVPIAMAARSIVWRDGTPVPATYRLVDEAAEIGHEIAVEVSVGDALTVEKIVTLFTGRDVATSEPAVDAQRWLSRLGRFAELRDGHLNDWVHLWERLSIEFEDFTDELRILRLHLLHLLQTVSPNSYDLDVGVPARGLHGEAYRGHIFWDELFIFPVLNLRMPMVTRSLLGYRYRRLPEARQAARAAGYSRCDVPVAIRQRWTRGKPTAPPQSAQWPVESRLERSCAPYRHRRRL